MERSMAIKENAVELLNKQLALRAKKNQFGIIVGFIGYRTVFASRTRTANDTQAS